MTNTNQNNIEQIFNTVYIVCSTRFSKDNADISPEEYESFVREVFTSFDNLAPNEIGDMYCFLEAKKEDTNSFAKTVLYNSMKNLLGRYTISKLSDACAITEEKAVSKTNNHTLKEIQSAETEISDILSGIPAENLAEIYPMIRKEYFDASAKTKWIGLLSYDEPQEIKTLPFVNDKVVREIAHKLPNSLITSKNQPIYEKMYKTMTTPTFMSDTLDSRILNSEMCSSFETAIASNNRAMADNCSKMINIMTEIEVANIIDITRDFIIDRDNGSLSIESMSLTPKLIERQFSAFYNNVNQITTTSLLSEITNKQEDLLQDMIRNRNAYSKEEIFYAKKSLKACDFVFDIKQKIDENQSTADDVAEADDVDVME